MLRSELDQLRNKANQIVDKYRYCREMTRNFRHDDFQLAEMILAIPIEDFKVDE